MQIEFIYEIIIFNNINIRIFKYFYILLNSILNKFQELKDILYNILKEQLIDTF